MSNPKIFFVCSSKAHVTVRVCQHYVRRVTEPHTGRECLEMGQNHSITADGREVYKEITL